MPHAPVFSNPARLALLVALAHLATTACTDEGGEAEAGAVDAIPTYQGTVDLEFGDIDGDDPYLFTRIGGIAEDALGRLIVADMQSHDIRVFDPEGRFLFRFGGPGEGPGEFNRPMDLAVRRDGRFAVFSLGHAAYQLFTPDGEFERLVRMSGGQGPMATFGAMRLGVRPDPLGNALIATGPTNSTCRPSWPRGCRSKSDRRGGDQPRGQPAIPGARRR